MIRLCLITCLFIVFSCTILFSQVIYPSDTNTIQTENVEIIQNENNAPKTDRIYQHDGTTMLVDVKKIQINDLYYSLPGETKVNKMDQRLVHKIVYKSGKVEILNEKPTEIRNIGDYRKVKVTYEPKDVEGLIEITELEARVDGNEKGNSTLKSLERSAIIVLRRQAANVNSDIILITDKKTQVAFGEIPFIILYAKAYSYK
ncbi:MAG: hypothetical protein A2X13_05325 [Bacteroidetes bacterium GWC2_33_15]|nr:MAG: hypothetical protein A2X10_11970 [Bacteroidetes bacterium GWA2_33_15]OFX51887.1 MAG: hypothetical protein A2X13_05325 [Bacteroidetes bacterium GWC2_33_15]OFX63455.1 MAG: hypothetical protein A2X15_01600 [Bacteroidetes bacterium GWB2_32_14]OFX67196.1 MAG: hypothetical protein A2X14_01150 [Bacteroidetes bacterium GWD2_33_33]HAN17079.1 hypothetical protein [Bacteroidales bacterium]